jgi:hypothetical protein
VQSESRPFTSCVETFFIGMHRAIFLKKIGSGTHSDPEFGWRRGDVTYMSMPGKKGSGMPFWLASF